MRVFGPTKTITMVTAGAYSTDYSACYADTALATCLSAPADSVSGNVSTATTTTILTAPASGSVRGLLRLDIVNRDATNNQTVTINEVAGATVIQLYQAVLSPGQTLSFDSTTGLWTLSPTGAGQVWVASGKLMRFNNSLTFTGTDDKTYTLPTTDATLARTDNAQTFTGTQTFSSTIAGSIDGNSATATTLATARAINGVDFNGSAAITVPVNNADDTTTNASVYPLWTATAGGNYAAKVSTTKLSLNPSTGLLTATGFSGPLTGNVTGNASGSAGSCTGNAATATKLATARAINGVDFDGSAAISIPSDITPGTSGNVLTSNGSVWTSAAIPTLNQSTTGSANSLKSNATTGLLQITGPAAGETRVITIPDADCSVARKDVTETFAGRVLIDDTTDATTATDGSLQTDGGLSVAKNIFAGDTIKAGNTIKVAPAAAPAYFVASAPASYAAKIFLCGNGSTLSQGFIIESAANLDTYLWNYANTALYFGTNNATRMTISNSGLVSTAGKINVDDTTDATNTTDGSLQTDGGLSVAKKGYFGSDVTTNTRFSANKPGGSSLSVYSSSTADFVSSTSIRTGVAGDGEHDLIANSYGPGILYLNYDSGTGGVKFCNGAGGIVVTVTSTGKTTIEDTTASTSSTIGALVVGGGVGIGGDLFAGGNVNVASGKVYKVNGTQVIGAQGAAVADATGAGDVVAQLNALLARCRAHGLIAT